MESSIELEKILNSEIFFDASNSSKVDNDDKGYGDCISLYIGGDIIGCLKGMREFGLLSEENLHNSRNCRELYIFALNRLDDIKNQGDPNIKHNVMNILKTTQKEDLDKRRYRYLKEYYFVWMKLLKSENSSKDDNINELGILVLNTIKTLVSDPKHDIEELNEFVEFYVFKIEIELKGLTMSPDCLKVVEPYLEDTKFASLKNDLIKRLTVNKISSKSAITDDGLPNEKPLSLNPNRHNNIATSSRNNVTKNNHLDRIKYIVFILHGRWKAFSKEEQSFAILVLLYLLWLSYKISVIRRFVYTSRLMVSNVKKVLTLFLED